MRATVRVEIGKKAEKQKYGSGYYSFATPSSSFSPTGHFMLEERRKERPFLCVCVCTSDPPVVNHLDCTAWWCSVWLYLALLNWIFTGFVPKVESESVKESCGFGSAHQFCFCNTIFCFTPLFCWQVVQSFLFSFYNTVIEKILDQVSGWISNFRHVAFDIVGLFSRSLLFPQVVFCLSGEKEVERERGLNERPREDRDKG